ncbi:MAG: DUF1015 domain-containing protein [Saprospiraceae bacterium]|nr:DUF1015 domain-containing protein [Saprospiraceae bacterium]
MHIRPFQAVYPNMDYITSADSFFRTVKEDYPEFRKSGFFNKSSQEGFYLYQIRKPFRTYNGLIACSEVGDFLSGHIKEHEHTMPDKEQRQMHLLLHRNAMVKPILLTYPRVASIETFMENYTKNETPFLEVNFEAEQEHHFLWEVTEGKEIQQLKELFDKHVKNAYIADGHHRSSTMAHMHQRTKNPGKARSYDQMLTAFFSTAELEILEYNRIVEGLSDTSLTNFMARLSQVADIEVLEGPAKPSAAREIVMYINKEWFLLKWKPSIIEKYLEEPILLDVSILNHEILEDIIGIRDIRTDERLRYVEGPKKLEDLKDRVLKNEYRIGFILFPIQMEDFLNIADTGNVLPPKSTWFEPRMRNGLIAQEF